MANNITKHTEREQLDFQKRLLKVRKNLPPDYIKKVLSQMPEANVGRIHSVRYGRTIDFEILEVFEEIAIKK